MAWSEDQFAVLDGDAQARILICIDDCLITKPTIRQPYLNPEVVRRDRHLEQSGHADLVPGAHVVFVQDEAIVDPDHDVVVVESAFQGNCERTHVAPPNSNRDILCLHPVSRWDK